MKNLRDIVSNRTSLDELKILLESPFEIEAQDIPLMYEIGHNIREAHGTQRGYDHSLESRIYLSHAYNTLKESGVSRATLEKFKRLIESKERGFLEDSWKQGRSKILGSSKTYHEEETELLREMLEGEESSKVEDALNHSRKTIGNAREQFESKYRGAPDEKRYLYLMEGGHYLKTEIYCVGSIIFGIKNKLNLS